MVPPMAGKTLSLDFRERILDCYDRGGGTQAQVAERFCVSLGMVRKLVAQRRHRGEIGPQHHRSGRKPGMASRQRRALRELVEARPDITLAEMRRELELDCTVQAIHYVLKSMGLTYKKRRSGPASRTAPISRARGGAGSAAKAASTRTGSSSSTRRRPRPT